MVIGHWSLVIGKEVEVEKGRKGDRRQSERLKLFVLNIITALRTSPAGKRSHSGKNGIFSAIQELP
jgi:hypothetical protein